MQEILDAVRHETVAGELACADAHAIAARARASPQKLGRLVTDETDVRFNRCQLGLFGYGPKAEGKSKIVLKAARIPEDIEQAIRAKEVNGRIACQDAWLIAERFKYPRLGIANIVEAMGLKVGPCQLGCF